MGIVRRPVDLGVNLIWCRSTNLILEVTQNGLGTSISFSHETTRPQLRAGYANYSGMKNSQMSERSSIAVDLVNPSPMVPCLTWIEGGVCNVLKCCRNRHQTLRCLPIRSALMRRLSHSVLNSLLPAKLDERRTKLLMAQRCSLSIFLATAPRFWVPVSLSSFCFTLKSIARSTLNLVALYMEGCLLDVSADKTAGSTITCTYIPTFIELGVQHYWDGLLPPLTVGSYYLEQSNNGL